MLRHFLFGSSFLAIAFTVAAAQPAQAPSSKIKPGEVNVPVGKGEQRLIFGELVGFDLKTRTGSFRNENNDEIMPFTVLPYASLMHHCANADLQDFKAGERCLFRLHQDKDGKWTWLTYIGDEMNFLRSHDCYYWVDALDAATGQITITRGNTNKTQVGETGVVLITDAATRYWKNGKPATFKGLKIGGLLRANTHGAGKGKTRLCREVLLDDESLQKFQAEQQAVHNKRMETEGLPAYVDSREGKAIRLTLFMEARAAFKEMKVGQKVRLAAAGVDRKATGEPVKGTITELKPIRKECKVAIALDGVADGLSPPGLVRVWLEP